MYGTGLSPRHEHLPRKRHHRVHVPAVATGRRRCRRYRASGRTDSVSYTA
jgi:hypothetical protein